MNDFLSSFGMILALLSIVAFFFGLVRLIFVKDAKFSLQLMLYSVIAFIIGFGTCYATFPYKF